MSQADELLNGLSNDDVAAYTTNSTEEHIVIGDDRVIRIPDALKRLAVQHDHDIETVTFDCPRYWDNHDMSKMKIFINYLLPDGTKGQYPAKNIVAVGKSMSFDWTISNNVTQNKGSISFLVCVVKTDADGNEERHWNSELNREAYISEGLECKETALHKYPDIITYLLTRMDEVEAIATPEAMQTYTDAWLEENHSRILAEIEAKGAATLATIPADYTETHNMAKESVRTKADAIVCTAQGELIAVSDSSDDHIRNLRVFGKTTQVTTTGKNLFDIETWLADSGVDWSKNDNAYTITTKVPIYNTPFVFSDSDIDVTFFCELIDKTTSNARFEFLDSNDNVVGYFYARHSACTCTASKVRINWTTTGDIIVVRPQIELGLAATEYEPYTGGNSSPSPAYPQTMISVENPSVRIHGKNLWDGTFTNFALGASDITDYRVAVFENTSYASLVVPVTPGRIYSVSCGANIWERIYVAFTKNYPANKEVAYFTNDDSYREGMGIHNYGSVTEIPAVEVPRDCHYMLVYLTNDTATYDVTQTWYQIESGPDVTEYEPPVLTPNALVIQHTLSGIPVTSGGNYTDANGQQWICDEIDFERGVYIQRVGQMTLTNDSSWYYNTDTAGKEFFYTADNSNSNAKAWENRLLCSHFPAIGGAVSMSSDCWTQFSGSGAIRIRHKDLTSLDELAVWLSENHVTICYVLAAPIETPLTAEELEAFKALKTNYPHTTVLNDAGAHMELSYNADTKTYVDNGIKQTVTDILEAIENGSY